MWITKQVVVVALHNEFKVLEFIVRNRLQHELLVRSVVKQAARLARAALRFQALDVAHINRTKELFWANRLEVAI